ncbi:alpha-pore-forming cytotoxin subunit MakB [Sorangium sp. So ce854]|uniref:Uncharacterized protein n=1 Tax=Sorangium cellulosum TaxID=56 RepID=A0A150PHT8_SORCE|nr:hypothetical protein BE08_05725 [Sorangium cellulosum]
MLSPTIFNTQDLLTRAFNEILRIDGYAITTQNTFVGKLASDPDWLTPVRSRIAMLAKAGASWTAERPDIWAGVLVPFVDYAAAFGGVAGEAPRTAAAWIDLLQEVLMPELDKAASGTSAADASLQAHHGELKSIQPLLADSINRGWQELAKEEQQMVEISAELSHLQDVIAELQSSITSTDISTGKAVVQSTVTMLYNVVSGTAASFSFLSMAGAAFTVGKTFYDIIHNTSEVADTLKQIAVLQLQASEQAQAAAGTKLVLQLLYHLELRFGAITNILPQIVTMWSNEREKLQLVIEALKSGADPATYFELATISVANSNWQAIKKFALQVQAAQTTAGPPVTLDPQQPSPAAP